MLKASTNPNLLVFTFETPSESNLEKQYLMDELGKFYYEGNQIIKLEIQRKKKVYSNKQEYRHCTTSDSA